MIPQKRLTRFYRISWKHQGRHRKVTDPFAGHRRLRFSFFTDEPCRFGGRSVDLVEELGLVAQLVRARA